MPVGTGSIVELNVRTEKATLVEALNDAFVAAAASDPLHGILGALEDEWASARILGETRSSTVDLPLTSVSGDDFISVAAWYANEAGYAMRLAETTAVIAAGSS